MMKWWDEWQSLEASHAVEEMTGINIFFRQRVTTSKREKKRF